MITPNNTDNYYIKIIFILSGYRYRENGIICISNHFFLPKQYFHSFIVYEIIINIKYVFYA